MMTEKVIVLTPCLRSISMKSFDYPVETFEKVVNELETFVNTFPEEEIKGVNKNYLSRIVNEGKDKNWESFVNRAYSVVRNLDEENDLFSILEPIKNFGDEKRMEKADLKVSLSIQCITIRDIEVELCAKFRDHLFLGTECLRNEIIPSIPSEYYINSNTTSTRRPFYRNRLLGYKYAPNDLLLGKIDEVIKRLHGDESVKKNGRKKPSVETSTTLYNKEESPHQLTYTSYLYHITLTEIEELFSPLFDQACEFLKGTPRDVVIIQDTGYMGQMVVLYPDGKYIPDHKYKTIKE